MNTDTATAWACESSWAAFVVRTEQGESRMVLSVTLPMTAWEIPVKPWVPITMRSEFNRSAS